MSIPGTWAEDCLIQATSKFLNLNFFFLVHGRPKTDPFLKNIINPNKENCLKSSIIMGHQIGVHFQSLIPLDEMPPTRPMPAAQNVLPPIHSSTYKPIQQIPLLTSQTPPIASSCFQVNILDLIKPTIKKRKPQKVIFFLQKVNGLFVYSI
jgi:hypothetical protein